MAGTRSLAAAPTNSATSSATAVGIACDPVFSSIANRTRTPASRTFACLAWLQKVVSSEIAYCEICTSSTRLCRTHRSSIDRKSVDRSNVDFDPASKSESRLCWTAVQAAFKAATRMFQGKA
eukprot:scaffold5937_cov275-Pinguiococcus_pyrenoidosus.AAC.3